MIIVYRKTLVFFCGFTVNRKSFPVKLKSMSSTSYVHGLFPFNNGIAGVFQEMDKHLHWRIV